MSGLILRIEPERRFDMRLHLSGKRVLVTGASSGIGSATARIFGEAGATVGVHYNRNRGGAEQTASAIEKAGAKSILLQGDFMREEDCIRTVEEFISKADGIDVLVNNAGALLLRAPCEEYDTKIFNDTFILNVTSAFVCTRTAIPHLRKAGGGSIIFLSSVATRFGPTGVCAYASAKTALNGLTMCLARELADDNIRVNAVAPGVIDTPFHKATPPERIETLKKMVLIKRLGLAEEIASVILFLASDAGSYITGQCIDVNGGMNLRC